jgi:hypothetical protein
MLETSHSLVAGSLAKLIPNPAVGLPVAIVSHFLLDLLPHWDLNTNGISKNKTKLIAGSLTDATFGLGLTWWLFQNQVNHLYLFLMILFACLPDWIESPYLVFNWKVFPFYHTKKLQSRWHWKLNLPWGLVGQLLLTGIITAYARLT